MDDRRKDWSKFAALFHSHVRLYTQAVIPAIAAWFECPLRPANSTFDTRSGELRYAFRLIVATVTMGQNQLHY